MLSAGLAMNNMVTVFLLAAASALPVTVFAEQTVVAFKKNLEDGRVVVVRQSVQLEHRVPTPAEQAAADEKERLEAEKYHRERGHVVLGGDFRKYSYSASLTDSNGTSSILWQKKVTEMIIPQIASTEEITIHDVQAKENRIAIVYSSARSLDVDVTAETSDGYDLKFSCHVPVALGEVDRVKTAHLAWLQDLYLVAELAGRKNADLWQIEGKTAVKPAH